MSPMKNDPLRLVVIGGGVAGLDIVTHLAGRRCGDRRIAVTLIDREPAYVWKPLLHTIAAGTAIAGMQETVFSAHARAQGFRYAFGEAVNIDRIERRVDLAAVRSNSGDVLPPRSISYDKLVLAVGSRPNDFGTPGVVEHCVSIDSRTDAIAFNDRLRVEMLRSSQAGRTLTVGIVGGGATGVELAAELIAVASMSEAYGLTNATEVLKVVLIEAGPRLLGPFPDRVAAAAHAKLCELGVDVRTAAKVTSVDETSILLEGDDVVEAQLKVWAAGVKAPPLLDMLHDLERTRSGQLVVDDRLVAMHDRNIFAVGDCASPRLAGRDLPVPTTAQAAAQQARYLSRYFPALVTGRAAPPVQCHDFGSLVSLGGFDAYGSLGRFGFFDGGFLRGRVAQLGHALLYRGYQSRLHGLWRGTLLWLVETLGRKIRPSARLS